jgi:hypothetical protein
LDQHHNPETGSWFIISITLTLALTCITRGVLAGGGTPRLDALLRDIDTILEHIHCNVEAQVKFRQGDGYLDYEGLPGDVGAGGQVGPHVTLQAL